MWVLLVVLTPLAVLGLLALFVIATPVRDDEFKFYMDQSAPKKPAKRKVTKKGVKVDQNRRNSRTNKRK